VSSRIGKQKPQKNVKNKIQLSHKKSLSVYYNQKNKNLQKEKLEKNTFNYNGV